MARSDLYKIKICSWNVLALQKPAKRTAVLSILNKENVSIVFLLATHLEDKDNAKLPRSRKLPFKSLECVKDSQGRNVIDLLAWFQDPFSRFLIIPSFLGLLCCHHTLLCQSCHLLQPLPHLDHICRNVLFC
uniref:Endonuclease/exonuclease/phosphatase domain-containing protein n=1 Tax=Fundulus heteroclitus TaxID=8078 RepID=A0A3Q2Q0K4_FUNHE